MSSSSLPWIAVTGFGAFVGVTRNPSGEVAEALAAEDHDGFEVRSAVLPVSFEGSPRALDRWLADQDAPPAGLLALGVHKEGSYRLERWARTLLHSAKTDNDGTVGGGRRLEGEDLETTLDLESLARALAAGGASEVTISEDAGGFVCERTYHHVLDRGRALGVPALFLHVPPAAHAEPARQVPVVRALLGDLARQALRSAPQS